MHGVRMLLVIALCLGFMPGLGELISDAVHLAQAGHSHHAQGPHQHHPHADHGDAQFPEGSELVQARLKQGQDYHGDHHGDHHADPGRGDAHHDDGHPAEHGCSGTQHSCPCHSSLSIAPGATDVALPRVALEPLAVALPMSERGPTGVRVQLERPPRA